VTGPAPPPRPRRRGDLTTVRRQVGDEVFYVVADPRTHEYVRLGEAEHALLDLLDGSRTLGEVAAAFEERTGSGIDPEDLAAFVDSLHEAGLVETAAFDPAEILSEFRARERAGLTRRRFVSGSLALLKFAPFNPDRQLGWLAARLRWCWSRSAFVLSAALVAAAAVQAAASWERLAPDYAGLLQATLEEGARGVAAGLITMWVVGGVLLIIHECAHGLTLKHYGGSVPEMGLALAYFQFPGAYTDTTASYLLPTRFQRVMVSLAGGYTGLVAASAAVFVWWGADPGGWVHRAALLVILLGGPLTLLFNWNPLVPYDGYYMFTDLFEAPNLLPRSFGYLGDLIRSRVFGVRPAGPRPPVRLRRLYAVYGSLAWIYQAMWVIVVPYAAYLIFSRVAGGLAGAVLAGVVTVRFARAPGAAAARFLQAVGTEKGAWLRRRRAGLGAGAAAAGAGILALLFTPLFPVHVHGTALLAASGRREVRAAAPGFLEAVLAGDGEEVAAGTLLARQSDPDLAARLSAVRVERDRARGRAARAAAAGDPASAASARAEASALESELGLLSARLDRLAIRALAGGTVVGRRLADRLGTYLPEGGLLCEIVEPGSLRAAVSVLERDLADVAEGARVVADSSGFPGVRFEGRVVSVPREGREAARAAAPGPLAAAAAPGLAPEGAAYEVEARLGGDRRLRPGMSVRVRIEGERRSLASRGVRAAVRLFRGKIWW
jgi:putative peptide zinc metalloprotease protein